MFGMFFTIGGFFAGSSDGGGELLSRKKTNPTCLTLSLALSSLYPKWLRRMHMLLLYVFGPLSQQSAMPEGRC